MVYLQRLEHVLVLRAILVHPADHVVAAVDARLPRRGGFLDHRLRPARRDRLRHAAFGLDAVDDRLRRGDQILPQTLATTTPHPRTDANGQAGLSPDHRCPGAPATPPPTGQPSKPPAEPGALSTRSQ